RTRRRRARTTERTTFDVLRLSTAGRPTRRFAATPPTSNRRTSRCRRPSTRGYDRGSRARSPLGGPMPRERPVIDIATRLLYRSTRSKITRMAASPPWTATLDDLGRRRRAPLDVIAGPDELRLGGSIVPGKTDPVAVTLQWTTGSMPTGRAGSHNSGRE